VKSTAVIFEQKEKVTVGDIDLPQPGDGDLLVRLTFSGISVGTERWALIDKRPEMKFPHVPGYQGVGIVEKVGRAVRDFAVGEKVYFTNAKLPEPYASNSWMGTHLATAVVSTAVAEDWPPFVCKVPEGIDDASAALANLAAVAVQGADMLRVTSKDKAVVLGMGMIGQCSAQVLQAKGADVVVADVLGDRINLAARVGCAKGVVLTDGPIAEQMEAFMPEGGFDIVVDTTSVAPVVQQLASLVRHRGQILLQGYYPGLTPMDLAALHGRRAIVAIPCATDIYSQQYAYRLLLGGQLKLSPLITHTFSPRQAPQAYQMILERPQQFLGIVFDWSRL